MLTLTNAVNAADHHQGNINAKLTLVEYGDFECSYCRHAYPLVKRLLKEKGNEIQFVFRNFPLIEIHRNAFEYAITAEAAGKQNKFWEMHDLIFDNHEKLTTHTLMSLAENLKLDLTQFYMDFASKEIKNRIKMDIESGVKSGVRGTPTFFLNGLPLLTYDESYESLLDAVELEIEMKQD